MKLKTVSLDRMLDKHIGEKGTEKRDAFEKKLNLELLGIAIKKAREEQQLTLEQLSEIASVQKSQILKMENNVENVSVDSVLKVLDVLGISSNFNLNLEIK